MKDTITTTLDGLETVALSKAVKDKEFKAARRVVDAGQEQTVDFVVRISGYLNVGEDQIGAKVPAAMPHKNFAIWMLSKMAPQVREKTVREFKAALDAGVVDGMTDEAKKEAIAAWDEIAERTRRNKKGVVTTYLDVTPIRPEALEALDAIEQFRVVDVSD